MRQWIQHHFNALHIYCRLVDLGLGTKQARIIASLYEALLTRHLLYRP